MPMAYAQALTTGGPSRPRERTGPPGAGSAARGPERGPGSRHWNGGRRGGAPPPPLPPPQPQPLPPPYLRPHPSGAASASTTFSPAPPIYSPADAAAAVAQWQEMQRQMQLQQQQQPIPLPNGGVATWDNSGAAPSPLFRRPPPPSAPPGSPGPAATPPLPSPACAAVDGAHPQQEQCQQHSQPQLRRRQQQHQQQQQQKVQKQLLGFIGSGPASPPTSPPFNCLDGSTNPHALAPPPPAHRPLPDSGGGGDAWGAAQPSRPSSSTMTPVGGGRSGGAGSFGPVGGPVVIAARLLPDADENEDEDEDCDGDGDDERGGGGDRPLKCAMRALEDVLDAGFGAKAYEDAAADTAADCAGGRRGLWARDVAAILSGGESDSVNGSDKGKARKKPPSRHSRALRLDRGGVAVSAPLRLTRESLAELRRRFILGGEEEGDSSGKKSSSSSISSAFRLPGLDRSDAAAADDDDAPAGEMEFLSTSTSDGPRSCWADAAASGGYVPDGYEDFQPGRHRRRERTVYLMEMADVDHPSCVRTIADFPGSDIFDGGGSAPPWGAATLEDYAIVTAADDDDDDDARPLSVSIMTSSRVVEILKSHSGGGGEESSYEDIRDALLREESAELPLVVGDHRPGRRPPSLVAVMTENEDDDGEEGEMRGRRLPPRPRPRSSSFRGELVFRFGRRRLAQEEGDPFSAQVSVSRFYVGRAVRFLSAEEDDPSTPPSSPGGSKSKPGENMAERPEEADDDSDTAAAAELLKAAALNSERFVPEGKRRQWDEVPDALISVEPYRSLPATLTRWLLIPGMRCSPYDLSFANCLLHLEAEFLLMPGTTFVTKQMIAPLFGELARIQAGIQQNIDHVRSEAPHQYFFNGCARLDFPPRQVATSTGTVFFQVDPDAAALVEGCRAVDEARGHDGCARARKSLRECARGYVRRVVRTLELERLRCLEDMRRHDLYSARWEKIEVAPPLRTGHGRFRQMPCRECGGVCAGASLCAYHLLCGHRERQQPERPRKGAPVAIESKEDLEMLSRVLLLLSPADRLVARLVVPGVAENFPLVSMGDLVRFRFTACGLTTEVIGEVVDVVIKTEVVSMLLPPPFNGGVVTYESLPYVQAILRTQTHIIDAGTFMQSPPAVAHTLSPALQAREVDDAHKQVGRFDLRLGFLGGRGFDIARSILMGAIERHGDDADHLCRMIAPTIAHSHIVQERKRRALEGGIFTWINPLNPVQKIAVNNIVSRRHDLAPYIIFGPAGTGKTLTVCEAVIQVLRKEPNAKILVCAPSDAACDVLASRILPILPIFGRTSGPRAGLLRINWWSRKAASLPPSLLQCTPMSPNGIFTIPPTAEIKLASVIVCQCFVAGCLELDSSWLMDKHFTHLFIDETSQAMECEALVPMLKVGKSCHITLAGDHKQLGPTVRDPAAVELGLGISIQERLMQLPLYQNPSAIPVMTRLVENYRSHDALLTVPSSLFYGGALKCSAPKEVASPYADLGGLGPTRFPLLLYDVSKGKEDTIMDSPSFYNLEECKAIVHIVQGLLKSKKVDGTRGTNTGDIAVITPFRSQVLMLRRKLRLSGLGSINVGVVEDFQGQETNIVIISTVLTRPHKRWSHSLHDDVNARLGFMHDPRRFNVAITRAHAVCVVVGHAKYLRKSETYWTALIEHIERNDGIVHSDDGKSEDKVGGESANSNDTYGIERLVRRVEELKLLGSGYEDGKYDLAFYYEDTPQWKVMLA